MRQAPLVLLFRGAHKAASIHNEKNKMTKLQGAMPHNTCSNTRNNIRNNAQTKIAQTASKSVRLLDDALLGYLTTFLDAKDAAKFARTNHHNRDVINSFRLPPARTQITKHLDNAVDALETLSAGRTLELESRLSNNFDTAQVKTLESAPGFPNQVSISSDGETMAVNCWQGGIQVSQRHPVGTYQTAILPGSAAPLKYSPFCVINAPIYFNKRGDLILGIVHDSILGARSKARPHLWQRDEKGQWHEHAIFDDHTHACRSAEFGPDDKSIVTTGLDGYVRIYQINSDKEWQQTQFMALPQATELRSVTDDVTVNFARFSPDGQHIVTHGADEIPRLWSRSTSNAWENIAEFEKSFSKPQFVKGNKLLLGQRSGQMKICDAASLREPQNSIVLGDIADPIFAPVISENGKQIAVNYGTSPGGRIIDGNKLKVFACNEAGEWHVSGILEGHTSAITSHHFSKSGKRLVTTSKDKSIRVWQRTNQETENKLLEDNAWRCTAVLEGYNNRVAHACFDPWEVGILSTGEDAHYEGAIKYWYR